MKLTNKRRQLFNDCEWFLDSLGFEVISKELLKDLRDDSVKLRQLTAKTNEHVSQYQMPLLSGTNQE